MFRILRDFLLPPSIAMATAKYEPKFAKNTTTSGTKRKISNDAGLYLIHRTYPYPYKTITSKEKRHPNPQISGRKKRVIFSFVYIIFKSLIIYKTATYPYKTIALKKKCHSN